MAGKKVIETGVDKLVRLINEKGQISIKEAAKELGISVSNIEEWADFLEEEGVISIQSKLATTYLTQRKVSKKDIVTKVKEAKQENEAVIRRVESSINAIQRDSEEIKLIDSEFRKIKSTLDDNFKKLSKKLENLENQRKSHSEMETRRKGLEDEYEKRLDQLAKKVKSEKLEYDGVMKLVHTEQENIKGEQKKIEDLKDTEQKLQKRLDDINKEISGVKQEIQKGNKELEDDETKLKKAEELAKKIETEIRSYQKDIEGLADDIDKSKKQLEGMEKEFISDVKALEEGKLDKVGAYRDAKKMVDSIKAFFDKTKVVEELIKKAEQEEKELKEHFEKMVKKAKAFSVLSGSEDVKKEIDGLGEELKAIEERKALLGGQLKKLRNIMRDIMR
ncbi:TPA: hypothetical protein HA265_06240 [Candidatus Woesearchaeota archaeon]|nr:hypothetical protein [Candidatus Woesearchaeota archaeon]